MRMCTVAFVTFVASLSMGAGCSPGGTYEPPTPDAGFEGDTVSAEDIGTPCTYSQANPETSPTNQCRSGLECAIVTREITDAIFTGTRPTQGFNTMGLAAPLHQDHLTIHNDDGTDTGYCTLLGTLEFPPACPLGTLAKAFQSSATGGFTVACLKPCTTSSECAAGAVCDARYFDDNSGGETGFCVKPCEADFPDCVRTAVTNYDPADQNALAMQLAGIDLGGSRVCNQASGLCEDTGIRGVGTDGALCADSSDCAEPGSCIQRDNTGVFLDNPYCATRCLVTEGDENGLNGTCGQDLCQPAMGFGAANLPVFDPEDQFGSVYPDVPVVAEGSSTKQVNGLCFDSCVDGFGCGTRTNVTCGELDADKAGAAWNERTMCLPDGLLLER
jgi:hypothetical protein